MGYHMACNLIQRGYRVDLIDNFTRGVNDGFLLELSKHDDVNLLDLDLLNKESFDGLDEEYSLIFHFAAIIGVQHVLRSPYEVLTRNVELLQNVIRFGKKQRDVERLTFASTSEVHAGTLRTCSLKIPTPENAPLVVTELSENRSSYMLSKIYGEALCLHSGLPTTIIRPHNLYGPRMGLSHVIPELFKKAFVSNDNQLEVFSLDHKRTFCYIDDAVEMIRLLTEADVSIGQAFNIGNESPEISIEELAGKIIEIVGKDLEISPGSTTEGSPQRRCPDMSKTFKATGFAPQINLGDGLKRTFDWYRTNVFLNEGLCAI